MMTWHGIFFLGYDGIGCYIQFWLVMCTTAAFYRFGAISINGETHVGTNVKVGARFEVIVFVAHSLQPGFSAAAELFW